MENNEEIIENTENEVNEQNTKENIKKKGNVVKDIIDIAESTIATIFVVVLIFTYVLHPVNIVGHSMLPTLNSTAKDEDTDKIFMSTVFFDVKYGDILVIDKMENYLLDSSGNAYIPESSAINECIIKRVIAVGGQTIDIRDGHVYVDDEMLNEPYINEPDSTADLSDGAFTGQYPITVPDGYYFVMGDNRNHSTDSRARSVGLIKKDQIYGKALVKYYPLNEFRILTDSWKG
ncbi:MAG: signal peptidase I [Ruminococcus sp.]|nr:signal peptidase I [Ruminococcus sp.]MDE7098508.1 signal peptidase I [Ruminococcus sp.]